MPKAIIVNLRRHSERKDSTKTGLSKKGIGQARAFGGQVKPDTKVYFGSATRNQSTARFALQKAKGLKFVPRQRNELTTSALKKVEWKEIVKRMGGKEKATRAWLDGRVPADVVLPPRIAADRIIRKKLRLAMKVARRGGQPVRIEALSHQENQRAVMERLLGRSAESLLRGKPIKPLEAIKFVFTNASPSRVEMTFRGKTFDVTERVEKILALKEEGAELK